VILGRHSTAGSLGALIRKIHVVILGRYSTAALRRKVQAVTIGSLCAQTQKFKKVIHECDYGQSMCTNAAFQ
jgi:hypothetical protein